MAGLCVLELLAIILLIVMKPQGNGRDDGKASAIATEAEADTAREKPIEGADNASVETEKYDVEIGQIIRLGSYEQDSDAANGKEAIEWRVLERDDETATVISRYAIEAKSFNIDNTEITWADCELRHWLNSDFYNIAFSSEEKSKIESVSATEEELMPSNAQSDDATVDHVFILSRTEANKLFSSDEERVCAPTRSAMMNDAWADRETGSCWWWTRTVDPTGRLAISVKGDGSINDRGSNITNRSGTVRPVIVIRLR